MLGEKGANYCDQFFCWGSDKHSLFKHRPEPFFVEHSFLNQHRISLCSLAVKISKQ